METEKHDNVKNYHIKPYSLFNRHSRAEKCPTSPPLCSNIRVKDTYFSYPFAIINNLGVEKCFNGLKCPHLTLSLILVCLVVRDPGPGGTQAEPVRRVRAG